MRVNTERVIAQIDAALQRWAAAQVKSKHDDLSDLNAEAVEVLTILATTIDRLAPPGTQYREHSHALLRQHGEANPYNIGPLRGILQALRADYEAGYVETVSELIHGDIFGDFLEMADYLLGEGYKDPAAVLAGGVLEEQLRKLCEKNGIDPTRGAVAKKASALNAELAAAAAHTKLDQKSVTAWLDLRNKAAHGKYDEYTKDQVSLMVQGIRDFVTRYPA